MKSSKRERIKKKIAFDEAALEQLQAAYLALISGQVQSYTIGRRSLTRFQLADLKDEMEALEQEIDELEGMLCGGKRRKAVGVIARDW